MGESWRDPRRGGGERDAQKQQCGGEGTRGVFKLAVYVHAVVYTTSMPLPSMCMSLYIQRGEASPAFAFGILCFPPLTHGWMMRSEGVPNRDRE
jgi:hypothetical protein